MYFLFFYKNLEIEHKHLPKHIFHLMLLFIHNFDKSQKQFKIELIKVTGVSPIESLVQL